jgi:hypothetical protein
LASANSNLLALVKAKTPINSAQAVALLFRAHILGWKKRHHVELGVAPMNRCDLQPVGERKDHVDKLEEWNQL